MNPRLGTEPALAALLDGLRAGGLDFADDLAKARADFEATLATIPVAEDFAFTRGELGGVPGLAVSYPGADQATVLLYLHGGAFIAGSAQGYRGLAANLARAAGVSAQVLDYRLAPEHRYPAALDDALAAYRTLAAQGKRIVVAGDSAGGGLALALLLALRDAGEGQPVAAVLLSPFANLACDGATYATKAAEDPSLTVAGLQAGAAAYAGGASLADPLLNPAAGALHGLAPLLIQVGSAEILLDDAVQIAARAGAAGTAVRLDIWPNLPHVFPAFSFMLEAGRLALADAGAFIRSALEGGQ